MLLASPFYEQTRRSLHRCSTPAFVCRAPTHVADSMPAARTRQGFARVSSSESEAGAGADDSEDGPSALGRDGGDGNEEARPQRQCPPPARRAPSSSSSPLPRHPLLPHRRIGGSRRRWVPCLLRRDTP